MRPLARAAAVLGVIAVATIAAIAAVRAPRAPSTAAVVTVDTAHPGRTVPRSFLGLSIEWDSVLPYTGPAAHRRAALLALLRPLARAAHAPLALRIGGDTSDQAWWNPRGRRRPPTILQDVGPATLDAVAWLARGLGAPVTLGLNLALRDPANALALARAARRRLPPGALEAVEIGNEPDLYTHGRSFRRGGHLHRRLRKFQHYSPAAYRQDAGRYLDALRGGLRPTPRLVVGGFAGNRWWPALSAALAGWRTPSPAVAGHLYALPQCDAAAPPASWLMSPEASRGRAGFLGPLAAIARRHRAPLWVTELNSAACGGRPRWSDTRAGALWLADTLFALLAQGAARADVHTWRGALYAPFAVAARGRVAPRPPLDGMAAFARAAPAGSRLAPVAVRGGNRLRAWATIDDRATLRVALLAPAAVTARIRAPRAAGCARLWRPRRGAHTVCSRRRASGYAVALAPRSVSVLTIPGRAGATAFRLRSAQQR